jgi:dienelactone hydrolase
MNRRDVLGCGAALLAGGLGRPLLAQTAAEPEVIDLQVGERTTKLSIWQPAKAPAGVLIFSAGGGMSPDHYRAIFATFVADGYAVFAPLHVDAREHPDHERYTLQTAFGERIADMGATYAEAARRYPGVPVAAVGHSYGSLIALCLGGALDYVSPQFRNPAVGAVLAFSSPGRIPGLIQPNAFAKVEVPVLMVTGTADIQTGFFDDPAQHLLPIETSPARDKFALVLKGGEHFLITRPGTPHYAAASRAAELFLAAYVAKQPGGVAALRAMTVAPENRWIVRFPA